jgi:hypothetical protein
VAYDEADQRAIETTVQRHGPNVRAVRVCQDRDPAKASDDQADQSGRVENVSLDAVEATAHQEAIEQEAEGGQRPMPVRTADDDGDALDATKSVLDEDARGRVRRRRPDAGEYEELRRAFGRPRRSYRQ